LYAFALDGTDHSVSLPGTTVLRPHHFSQFVVSGDLSRALAPAEDAVVLDLAGGAHTRFSLGAESFNSITATTSASVASGARFALIAGDRVHCIEAGPGVPAGAVRNVNSGVGPEQDGLFLHALVPGSDRA
jgi:hypothetical protein